MATAITSALTEKVSVTPGRRIFSIEAKITAIRNDAKRRGSSQRQWTADHRKMGEPSVRIANRYTLAHLSDGASRLLYACVSTSHVRPIALPVRWCPR